eukprot:1966185-Pyramimonas_sp.AAC.1
METVTPELNWKADRSGQPARSPRKNQRRRPDLATLDTLTKPRAVIHASTSSVFVHPSGARWMHHLGPT